MTNHLESSKMQILWRTKKHGWEFVTSRLKKTKDTNTTCDPGLEGRNFIKDIIGSVELQMVS